MANEMNKFSTSLINAVRPKKICLFCQDEKNPIYTDIATLQRFVTDRGKITSRLRTGVCSRHQRVLSKEIKHARHLSLLTFTVKL